MLFSGMRILVNTLTALGPKTGIGNYTLSLLAALRTLPEAPHLVTHPAPWLASLIGRLRRGGPGAPAGKTSGWKQGLQNWLRNQLDAQFWRHANSGSFDLVHEPNNVARFCNTPYVLTLHDLSAMLHPEWHPADRAARYERSFREGISRAAHIVTVSESTRQDAIKHLGIAPNRITTTPLGVGAGLGQMPESAVRATLNQLGLTPDYLLYLGTVEPRKNLLMLLKAYCNLPSHLRDHHPLILAGGWGWKFEEVAEYYRDVAQSRGVRHIGYVADEHRSALYNGARALVFPSHHEGFGLPPLEMLACGGAVLASDIPAHREVVGGQACLLPTDDLVAWRDAMTQVLTDDEFYRNLRIGSLAHAARYTWKRCAEITLSVYRHVISPKQQLARAG